MYLKTKNCLNKGGLRLPFGTSASSEIFSKKLLKVSDGLAGVICVADDVIIHGKTLEDHDKHLDVRTTSRSWGTRSQSLEELRRFLGMVNCL